MHVCVIQLCMYEDCVGMYSLAIVYYINSGEVGGRGAGALCCYTNTAY